MTGASDIRERIGAVFFVFVMVTSMVVVGIGGLAGGAAAAATQASVTTDTPVTAGSTVSFTADIDSGSAPLQVFVDTDRDDDVDASEITKQISGNTEQILLKNQDPTAVDTPDSIDPGDLIQFNGNNVTVLSTSSSGGTTGTITVAGESGASITNGANLELATKTGGQFSGGSSTELNGDVDSDQSPGNENTLTLTSDANFGTEITKGEVIAIDDDTDVTNGVNNILIALEDSAADSNSVRVAGNNGETISSGENIILVDDGTINAQDADDDDGSKIEADGNQDLDSFAQSSQVISDSIQIPASASGDVRIGFEQDEDQLSVGDTSQTATNDFTVLSDLQGSGNGQVDFEITPPGGTASASQAVTTGQANVSLGLIKLQDVTDQGAFSGSTTITLPEGVTVNESASSLNTNTVTTSTSDGVQIDSVSVVNNGSEIELEHAGTSTTAETIRIGSGALVVSVDGDGTNTAGTSTALDVDVDYSLGSLTMSGLLSAQTPDASFQSAPGSLPVNTDNQNLDDDFEITDVDAGEIGNATDVVVSLEDGSGVTFDKSVDPTAVLADAGADFDGDADTDIDTSEITITDNEVRLPIIDPIDGTGNTIDLDADGNLQFNTTGNAQSPAINVSVTSPPVSGGAYQLEENNDGDPTISSGTVTVDSPGLTYGTNNDPVVIGANDQELGGDLTVDLSTPVSENSFLNITTNNSDVTFDTSTDVSASDLSFGNDIDSSNVNNVTVESDAIAIGLGTERTENDGDFGGDGGDSITVGFNSENKFSLNVSNAPADNTNVQFNASNGPVQFVDSTNELRLERPDTTFNGGSNATVNVDNDGEQVVIDNSQDTLIISSDDVGGQISDATNVTVTLDTDTGVTFDKSAPTATDNQNDNDGFDVFAHAGTTIDGGDETVNFDVDGNDGQTFTGITVNDNSIEISLADDGGDGPSTSLSSDESIVIDEVPLNATAGASNTTVSVTTNTSDAEVTTELTQIIVTSQDTPSNLAIDADGSNGFTNFNNGQVTGVQNPQVDNTVTGAVRVQNSGNFGGATVNLDIVETPDGASGSSLNTTQLTTNQNGVAFYNFTAGDTTGDYVVNATVSETGTGLNVTYTAQPGAIDGVRVTPIENAIAGDSAETGVAALHVNATDANGNKVTGSSPTVGITADNVGISNVEVDPDFLNSVTASNVDSEGINNDGTFSLHSADGSSVVLVKSSQIEDVTITAEISGNSDTGTVTFFDEIGDIDLTLNQSTVEVGDTVAAEATISESDGTTIEVPDVTVNYDDSNDGNTTFGADADAVSATTNDAGVASVNVTAEQLGSSTIDAQSNLRSANATLTVEPADAPVSDPVERFDTNGEPGIQDDEVLNAISAFNEGEEGVEAGDVLDVISAFNEA